MTRSEWLSIFSNNLADIMKERRMSQRQLANKTGLSVSRISDYINENATPTIYTLINVAYALDVSLDELANFDEEIDD